MLSLKSETLNRLLALLLIVTILLFFHLKFEVSKYHFHADENDYMQSTNQGFLANYLDSKAPSAWIYLADAFSSFKSGEDIDTFQKYQDSIHNFRHYHGAVGFYPFVITKGFFPNINIRLVPIFLILCFAIYWLFNNSKQTVLERTIFLLLTVFLLIDAQLNLLVSPHLTYLFLALTFLNLTGSNIQRDKLYGCIFCLVLAFCSLEFSLLLPCAWFLSNWQSGIINLSKLKFKECIQFLGKLLLISLMIMLLVWPAGVFKLTMPLSYLVYAALALKSNWYEFYSTLIFKDYILTVLLAITLITSLIYIIYWKKLKLESKYLSFAWYTLLMLGLNLMNNFVYKAYVIQATIPGLVILSLLLKELYNRKKNLGRVSIGVVLLIYILLIQSSIRSAGLYQDQMHRNQELLIFLTNEYLGKSIIVIGYTPVISKNNLPDKKIIFYPEIKNYNSNCKNQGSPNSLLVITAQFSKQKEEIECLKEYRFSSIIDKNLVYLPNDRI